ncbi:MAG: diguanylate cyclase [Sedimentisphaerales bacterium]|nr:diguanylate cyclase [Sedimentisphaerales bacterium]
MAENQKKSRKILTVDDNQTNLILMKVYLEKMGVVPLVADNALDGLELAYNEKPDVILLDIMMPDMDGHELCRRLKSDTRTASIPIIFVSARDTAEDKITGLELGAIDYIFKPLNPGELRARVGAILRMLDLQEELLTQANTDPLTGLANRRHFFEIFERQIIESSEKNAPLSLVMIDLDFFKSVNDTYGHIGGDNILKQLAAILKNNLYSLDFAARYGGEEFIISLFNTDIDHAVRAAEKLRSFIQSYKWNISDDQLNITISLGVATMDASTLPDPYELVSKADKALYAAKSRGRNCVVRWDDIQNGEEESPQKNDDASNLQTEIHKLEKRLRSQATGSIAALGKTIAVKDPFIANHAENVHVYAEYIAREMSLSSEQIETIKTAALLHDIGMIGVPAGILTKSTPLTEQERAVIRQHPLTGVRIISQIGIFHQELNIIKHHHENFDGTGYPDALVGKNIPFGARILAAADIFDAITSDRSHRKAFSHDEAIAEITACAGNRLDPEIVEALLKTAANHPEYWPLKSSKQSAPAYHIL